MMINEHSEHNPETIMVISMVSETSSFVDDSSIFRSMLSEVDVTWTPPSFLVVVDFDCVVSYIRDDLPILLLSLLLLLFVCDDNGSYNCHAYI